MLVAKVDKSRWDQAQAFEYDIWAPMIKCNPLQAWENMDQYFHHRFHVFLERNWSGKTVLEIGTGPSGAMWLMNAKRRIGVEPLADKLKAINPNLYHGYEMIPHGAEELPEVKNESVDAVISFNALDHCQDVEAVLSEADRVLKSGGHIAIGCDLKSEAGHLDQGHPIALSYEWFVDWFKRRFYRDETLYKITSRNNDPETGKDNLDGCIIGIWKKS